MYKAASQNADETTHGSSDHTNPYGAIGEDNHAAEIVALVPLCVEDAARPLALSSASCALATRLKHESRHRLDAWPPCATTQTEQAPLLREHLRVSLTKLLQQPRQPSISIGHRRLPGRRLSGQRDLAKDLRRRA